MKRVLSILLLISVSLAIVGTSPQFFAKGNPMESSVNPVILLTSKNISQPMEPQIIPLPLNAENASGIPPRCSLILHEANLNNVKFTLRIVGTALHWQNENIETWLTADDQAPVKLNRIVLQITTAALLGGIFTSEYNSTLSSLSEGYHIIKIQVLSLQTCWDGNVSDYYGSNKLDYFVGSVLFKIDTTYPIIGDISIKNSTYFTNNFGLSCTTNEPFSWIAYSLDDQGNVTIKTNYNAINETTQASANLTGLTEGTHSLTIYANDTAGNMGASQTIAFTVDTIVPTITVLAATLAVVIVASLLVHRRHRRTSVAPG